MKKILAINAAALGLVAMLANTARSEVSLPKIFSDHMVLQRAEKTPVWGTATPGEKVRVQLGTAAADTQTGEDGRWQVNLDLRGADTSPLVMQVEGANKIRIEDVLVGEVWLCAGQSNMEFPLGRAIGVEVETSKAPNPMLRQFLVQQNSPLQPTDRYNGKWQTADAATIKSFSAVGYFFGLQVQATLQMPVGLIKAAVGATPVEAWTSREGLAKDADLKTSSEGIIRLAQDLPQLKKDYAQAYQNWEKSSGRADRPTNDLASFVQPSDGTDWKKITLPATFSAVGLPDAGAVWLAKKIEMPAAKAGQPFVAAIGMPAGWETVYWNGIKIGARTPRDYRGEGENRVYNIPAAQVKVGANVLCVRLFNATGGMGISGKPSIEGDWMAKAEFALPALTDQERREAPGTFKALPEQKKIATVLFNGMIQPLVPYGMKGVIWYQGEQNAERAFQYRKAFPLLIQDWRMRWGEGNFPFYFCQLANYHAKSAVPEESEWAELREAQTMALSAPNTGEAILIDVGEAADIHPRDKRSAGERLAALALSETYGRKLPFAGPRYQSMTVEGSAVRLRFGSMEGGLVARPLPASYMYRSEANDSRPLTRNSPESELEGFAICGDDHRWVWANARIDGETVLVESPQVTRPVAVRYGWASNPTCNLYNRAGFPAGPFRTDDFPALTADKRY